MKRVAASHRKGGDDDCCFRYIGVLTAYVRAFYVHFALAFQSGPMIRNGIRGKEGLSWMKLPIRDTPQLVDFVK